MSCGELTWTTLPLAPCDEEIGLRRNVPWSKLLNTLQLRPSVDRTALTLSLVTSLLTPLPLCRRISTPVPAIRAGTPRQVPVVGPGVLPIMMEWRPRRVLVPPRLYLLRVRRHLVLVRFALAPTSLLHKLVRRCTLPTYFPLPVVGVILMAKTRGNICPWRHPLDILGR